MGCQTLKFFDIVFKIDKLISSADFQPINHTKTRCKYVFKFNPHADQYHLNIASQPTVSVYWQFLVINITLRCNKSDRDLLK